MVLALEREPRQKRQWGRVVARAWDDDGFRQRLLDEPESVLREEGIDVPPDVAVQVIEGDTADAAEEEPCFWQPPSPTDDDLTADDLGLPSGPVNISYPTHGRTRPGKAARLSLPARPASDDVAADDLGLPPGAFNHVRSGRTRPAVEARLSLPARPAVEDLTADDLGLPPGAFNIAHSHRTRPR